jgi:thiamine kinase
MIDPAILRRVPGGAPRIAPLGGARDNRLWRIDTDAGSFALRQRLTASDPPGVERQRELTIHSAAAAAGLAPRVIAADPAAGWLLMEHVSGAPWTDRDFCEREPLLRLGERLARLHALPPAPCPPFDALAIARGQLARIEAARPGADHGLAGVLAELQAVELQLQDLGRGLAMNHGDLDAANLLGPAPLLIDWEYAQLTDPLYDLACILAYYPGAWAHRGALLGAADLGDALSARRLPLQLRQFGLLNQLWKQAEALPG